MSQYSEALFDTSVLPSAIETDDADILLSFYEMFIEVTRESWLQLPITPASSELSRVRDITHKLKSSAASVGALRLRSALQSLEQQAADQQATGITEHIAQTALVVAESLNAVQAHVDLIKQR